MKIEIRLHRLETSRSLREHILRRIHHQLSRFGLELRSVTVRLTDLNGPREGVDKRCHVMARGKRFEMLAVDETSADEYSAVDVALERLARSIGRELARRARVRRAALEV